MGGDAQDYKPGSMDISGHLATWHGFVTFTKWAVIFNVLVMIFLAIFRTHN